MHISLDYYSTYGPTGKIYARCLGEVQHCTIHYHLYNGDTLVQKKTAYGNELIAFLYSSPSKYKIVAQVDRVQGETIRLCSEDIQPVLVDLLPPPILDIKPIKGPVALVPDQQNYLVVKFVKGGLKKLVNENSCKVPTYYNLRHAITFIPSYDKTTVDKIVKYSPELENLRYIYRVVPDICNQQLLELANELQCLDYVEFSDLLGVLGDPLADDDQPQCDPVAPVPSNTPTPDFEFRQGYLNAPLGMNIRAVWNRGFNGQGIHVRVRDAGIFPNHEDLVGVREISGGFQPDHGSASAGVILARNNGFGVTGIAFSASGTTHGDTGIGMNEIMVNALPGEVVTMSLGNWATGIRLPIIHDRLQWDNLGSLVNSGVVVVIAAANGGRDLSHGPFTDHGDNGVIVAGACDPNTGRRVQQSNFNLRNFLNSWGASVASCGYGNMFDPGSINRRYTGTYNSTSSATALIAGALALIQSYARTRYNTIFNNRQMYNIIRVTGYQQGVVDLIGQRPNAEAAINYIDQLLGGGGTPPPPPPPPPSIPDWIMEGMLYKVGDLVRSNGVIWRCTQEHVSNRTLFPGSPSGSPWVRQDA